MPGHRPTGTPMSIDRLFDIAIDHLAQASTAETPLPSSSDGFIFSGNRHDSVPRALLTDKRLTPLERNAWQVLRLLINDDGITAFPAYNQLAPWLASMPCTDRASHETVARALALLRLTRWISLVRRRRDPTTGRMQGNLYVLHDEPLTLFEAIQLDQDYLGLVSNALAHASKSVQRVGLHTLREVSQDPQLTGKTLPSRIQVLTKRLREQHWMEQTSSSQEEHDHESEEGHSRRLRNGQALTSVSEAGRHLPENAALPNPKTDSTVRNEEHIKDVRTVRAGNSEMRLPERFSRLNATQQAGALSALQAVDSALRQAVVDEWNARCRASTVRNPAGYLFGIIQKAIRGEFQPWAGQQQHSAPVREKAEPPSSRAASPEVAQEHINRLRSLLRIPR